MLGALFLLGGARSAQAKLTRFEMRDAGGRNLVEFVSDGLLEKTVGTTGFVSGWAELDPEKLDAGLKAEFEVDLRTFQTGIEARNQQLREKWLEASEYPLASFVVTRLGQVSRNKLSEGEPVTARVEGNLKARGLSRPATVLLKLVYFHESELTKSRLPGNLLKCSASFDIDTAAYNVTIPDAMKARFSRYLQVFVDLVGTDQLPVGLPPTESPKPKK